MKYGGKWHGPSRTNPAELAISVLFSRDRMHHSVGWWRNAEYEYCYHLSLSALAIGDYRRLKLSTKVESFTPHAVDIPDEEVRFWAHLIFGKYVNLAWHEPGGTDPRLSPEEARDRAHFVHLRVFMHPLTMQPFIPRGEVYHLTRWIPGLTPEKVDR